MTNVIINWNGTPVKTRTITTGCGRFRVGDFLLFQGELTRIEAVQNECFAIENLHKFTMVTLETRSGKLIPVRSIGVKQIHRVVR